MKNDIEFTKITDTVDLANYRDILARFRKAKTNENFQISGAQAFMAYFEVSLAACAFDTLTTIQAKIREEAKIFLFQFHT